MSMTFLDQVYSARGDGGRIRFYDAWAKTYEADLADTGCVTPGRCALVLHSFPPDRTAPILRVGSGKLLQRFHEICDPGLTKNLNAIVYIIEKT